MSKSTTITGTAGRSFAALLTTGLVLFATTEASAQQETPPPQQTPQQQQFGQNSHPGSDMFSLNLHGGGFFSGSSFAGGASFENTGAVGGTLTFWAHPNVGIRANALWYNHAVEPGTQDIALLGEDPDAFHYSGDLVLRMPAPAGATMSWFPYIVGGVGGKTYDFQTEGTATDFAGNVGAGLEVRFGEMGRWGVHTEVRDFISNFQRLEVDQTLHDVIWTGGISINF